MSWETLAAGQQLARNQSASFGGGGSDRRRRLADELATKKLDQVYAVEHALLAAYTADGYTAALEQLIRKIEPVAGAVPAHLPGARLRAQARHALRTSTDQRRDRRFAWNPALLFLCGSSFKAS